MAVRYLKDGEDFSFPKEFGFSTGATPDRADDGTYVARQRFAEGGAAKKRAEEKKTKRHEKKADGGSADDTPMRQAKPDKPARSRVPDKPMPELLGDMAPDERENYFAEHNYPGERLNDDEQIYHATNPPGRLGGQYARGGPPMMGALGAAHGAAPAHPTEPTLSMPLSQAAATAAHLVKVGAQHGAQMAAGNIAKGIAQRRAAEQGPRPPAPAMGAPPMGPPPGARPATPPPGPPGGAPPMMGHPPGPPAGPMMAEGGHWIQGAKMHKGALHRELGVPEGQPIPASKLNNAAHSDNPTLKRRATLAKTLKGLG